MFTEEARPPAGKLQFDSYLGLFAGSLLSPRSPRFHLLASLSPLPSLILPPVFFDLKVVPAD